MGKLSEAKTFGGIGAILMLVGGFIPYAGPVIYIVGLVLIFMAVRYIADVTKDNEIFQNYLIHFIVSIIAIVAVVIVMIATIGLVGGITFFTSLDPAGITDFTSFWDYFGPLVGGCAAALLIGWILSIISAVYLRRSYDAIKKQTKVDLFGTVGLIYFIGAITLIIAIGALILLIAKIIEIVAYFSLPEKLPTQAET